MASDMTISKVLDRREWSGQHGPMVTYKIEIEGHGPAELNQKPTSPPPQEGQSIFGDLVPNANPNFPPKLKKVQQGGFGGGGKSPEEQKSIRRQSAQQRAALYLIAKSLYWEKFNKEIPTEEFKGLVDWFEKDAA
jgi:hypothetical protein